VHPQDLLVSSQMGILMPVQSAARLQQRITEHKVFTGTKNLTAGNLLVLCRDWQDRVGQGPGKGFGYAVRGVQLLRKPGSFGEHLACVWMVYNQALSAPLKHACTGVVGSAQCNVAILGPG